MKHDKPLYVWRLIIHPDIYVMKYTLYEYDEYIDYNTQRTPTHYVFEIKDDVDSGFDSNVKKDYKFDIVEWNCGSVITNKEFPMIISISDRDNLTIYTLFKYEYEALQAKLSDDMWNIRVELNRAESIYNSLLEKGNNISDNFIVVEAKTSKCDFCSNLHKYQLLYKKEEENNIVYDYADHIITIKYCPYCGRKLSED